jgi:hypothetical protein
MHQFSGFCIENSAAQGSLDGCDAICRASYLCAALRFRVAAAFFAEAERALAGRFAAAAPPSLPPLRDETWLVFLPRPLPLFFPPPVSLLTVAHARRSASASGTPRCS